MVMGVGSRKEHHLRDGEEPDAEIRGTPDPAGTESAGADRVGLWVLGAILLLILSVAVFVSALRDSPDNSRSGTPPQAALQSAAAQAARPTSDDQAESVTTRIVTLVADVEKRYDVSVGVSLRAGGGVVHVGAVQDLRAWSTVKVPVALAAVQKSLEDSPGDSAEDSPEDSDGADLAEDLRLALGMSDNDAALRLWQTLGTDEQSSAAVDAVFREAGDPTDAEGDRGREDYGGFGDVHWSLDNQVIFSNRLACLDGSAPVLDQMGQVVPEHRRGLGLLPGARFKGGWGGEPDGNYLLREFGLVGERGSQVPLAVAVLSRDGSDATARQASGALAEAMEPLIAELPGLGGKAECQVPDSVPAASTAAPVDQT